MRFILFYLIFLSLSAGLSCSISPPGFPIKTINSSTNIPLIPTNPAAVSPGLTPNIQPGQSVSRDQDPYPYDLLVDNIAFMSCPLGGGGVNALFPHFQFASQKQGVELSKGFKQQFSRRDHSRYLKISKFVDSRAQISFSQSGAPNASIRFSQTQTQSYCSALGLFPSFSRNDNKFINNISDGKTVLSVNNRKFNLRFPTQPGQIPDLSSFLNRDYGFSLTYGLLNSRPCVPIHKEEGLYHGRHYSISLAGGINSTNYLNSVSERSLDRQTNEQQWECKNNLRIPIVRHDSISTYYYKNYTDYFKQEGLTQEAQCRKEKPDLSSQEIKLVEEMIGRNLSLGVLYVANKESDGQLKSTKKPCITPNHQTSGCYGTITRIGFNEADCTTASLSNTNVCPAYFSICTRR